MTSTECFAKADQIEKRYTEWKASVGVHDAMNEMTRIGVELYSLRFDRFMDMLRTIRQMCTNVPNEPVYREALDFFCSKEPQNPLSITTPTTIQPKFPQQTKYGIAYSTLQDAIKEYNNSFAIVEFEGYYIACKTKDDVEGLAYSKITQVDPVVMFHEIIMPESPQKLSLIIESSDKERLENAIGFLLQFFRGRITRDDIVIEPREGTTFAIVRTIVATYYEHKKTFDTFVEERKDIYGDMMSLFKLPEIASDPKVGDYLKIRWVQKMIERGILTDATIDSIKVQGMPPIVINDYSINVSGNTIHNETTTTVVEEKVMTDKQYARTWAMSNPPRKLTTTMYYEKYKEAADASECNYCLPKHEFSRVMQSLGYSNEKDRDRNGRYFWFKSSKKKEKVQDEDD
jgi:hypothetical protein